MLLNVLLSDVPMEFTAATITIEIPAAISAYSIAVAPESLFAKRVTSFHIGSPAFGHRSMNADLPTFQASKLDQ